MSQRYISQCVVYRRPLVVWSVVAAISLLLILLILAAPLTLAAGHVNLGLTIYLAFSNLCHQNPDRSFFIAGHKFAVCARCTGLYFGFAMAVLVYPLVKSLRSVETAERKWLFMAAAPMAVDFGLGFLGIWENTQFSRFSTGALLGVVSVFYIIPGLIDLSFRDWFRMSGHRRRSGDQAPEPTVILPGSARSGPSDYSAPYRRI
jgi:uncharacterized membrane protein